MVWTLSELFAEPALGADLTFKGGTSLSKAYKVIDRFSEDLDLTCDIRKLIPDLVGESGELPVSRSQADRWTQEVRRRLPGWVAGSVQPALLAALEREGLDARLVLGGPQRDKLLLSYPALAQGTGYVAPVVTLEFGGRSTGEPSRTFPVSCDLAEVLPEVSFPQISTRVLSIVRTFWEKATAAHVYCAQGRLRGERFARHWHDLAAIGRSSYLAEIVSDRAVGSVVARHKSLFFVEKDAEGRTIDYAAATAGRLRIVPDGDAKEALAMDYSAMVDDEVMVGNALPFGELMQACANLEDLLNGGSGSHFGILGLGDVP